MVSSRKSNSGGEIIKNKLGEPYALPGNRMTFTDWFYVRPGSFAWMNDAGNAVTVFGGENPGEASLALTDHPRGIKITCKSARKTGPVVRCEKPWEVRGIDFRTVIHEDGRYRAWGVCDSSAPGAMPDWLPCYFESADGLEWTRPNLGRENNLLAITPGAVFADPSAPASERYKSVFESTISREEFESLARPDWSPLADRKDIDRILCLQGMVSPDGLDWTLLPDVLSVEHSDTLVTAYYDQALEKYVVYTRAYPVKEAAPGFEGDCRAFWGGDGPGPVRRSIGRTESDNFRSFPVSSLVLAPNAGMAPDDVLYTTCRTSFPGAPDRHLMFPALWHTSTDTTSIAMVSSFDGKLWDFVPGGNLFTIGDPGEWDCGHIFAVPNLIELPGGDFALPYTGSNIPHKYPRAGEHLSLTGYALWPKGRIASLAAEDYGEFATAAVVPPGKRLSLNAVTEEGGSILVEAADIDSKPLPGRTFDDCIPLAVDCFNTRVVWKGGEEIGADPVILRFRMKKAELFWIQFD